MGKQRSRDPEDDPILGTALAGHVKTVVTRDNDLLELGKPFGIEILHPRDFLRKLTPGARGVARVDASALSAGEQQLCMLLTARGKAVASEEDGRTHYLIDPDIHEYLLDSLASQGFRLKASAPRPA